MRERGLKDKLPLKPIIVMLVAPRAGAWIESHADNHLLDCEVVAPRAGAWIESAYPADPHNHQQVAPRAGAWIESSLLPEHHHHPWSLPVRERGLKAETEEN